MTARERAKAASDKFKADFVGSVADKYYMGYLAGWREALEAAYKVAQDHADSEARWADHYHTKEPNLEFERDCLSQVNAALEIKRDIRRLAEGDE